MENENNMEFLARRLGEINGKLTVLMSHTPTIPSHEIVRQSLWRSFRENGFPGFHPVLVRGRRVAGERAMIREGRGDVVYRCVNLPRRDIVKYIRDGEAGQFKFTEWAYCDELYDAEHGR